MTVTSVRIFDRTEVAAFTDRDKAEVYIAEKPWRNAEGNAELTLVELDIPAKLCAVCEEQAVTSTNPEIDFCRNCLYTGRAMRRVMAAGTLLEIALRYALDLELRGQPVNDAIHASRVLRREIRAAA